MLAIDGRVTGVSNGYDWVTWQANGDTGSNYDALDNYTVGTTPQISRVVANTFGYAGVLADSAMDSGVAGRVEGVILDYSGTAWDKAVQAMYGSVGGSVSADYVTGAGQSNWRSTAPVTSLKFAPENGNFALNTVITLYGRGGGSVLANIPVGTFNGSDDYVGIADAANLQFGTGDFTVTGWVLTRQLGYTGSNSGVFISKEVPLGTGGFELAIYTTGIVAHVSTFTGFPSVAIAANVWYYVTLTRASGTCNVYINGGVALTATSTGSVSNIGTDLYFGTRFNDVAGSAWFNGKLYDWQAYNTALTGAQVNTLYNTGGTIGGAGLVSRWKYDEGTGSTVGDSVDSNPGSWNGSLPHWSTR